MSNPQDKLIRKAKAGDRNAVERLLYDHLPALRVFVRLRQDAKLRAKESASDLVQSVCRDVLSDIGSLQGENEQAFKNWLYSCALHKLSNRRAYYHAAKRDVDLEQASSGTQDTRYEELLRGYSTLPSPSQHVAAREQVERIEAAFDQLPDNYREVLLEVRLRGLGPQELAQVLGKSEEAVRQLLWRARARLAMMLD